MANDDVNVLRLLPKSKRTCLSISPDDITEKIEELEARVQSIEIARLQTIKQTFAPFSLGESERINPSPIFSNRVRTRFTCLYASFSRSLRSRS
jgi:hypothetical protein